MPPAVIAAGIGAAGAIGGGLLASSSASKAAKAQTQSAQAAMGEQSREFDTTQKNFAPYLGAGTGALGGLTDLFGMNGNDKAQAAISALQQSPLYQSLYRNGLEANLQNASATGGLRGGNEARSLADFGSDTLAQVIQNQIGNLGGIASLGANSTNAMAGFGQNNANAISSLLTAQGNARAGAAATQGGIWSGLFNNITPLIERAAEPSLFSGTGLGSLAGAGSNLNFGIDFNNVPLGGLF
jgi:hypothetical protein